MNASDPNRDMEEADNVLTSSRSTGTKNHESPRCATLIASDREAAGSSVGRGNTATLGAADWLSLAAAPTFAIMAFLVGASSEASPLGGMVLMYVLMAAFESVAWLKLISSRRGSSRKE
jgi:hypothetical protein